MSRWLTAIACLDNPDWPLTLHWTFGPASSLVTRIDWATDSGAVRDALVNRYGIAPGRLVAKGYGLARPVETNATFQGRARNRRVELARPCAQG